LLTTGSTGAWPVAFKKESDMFEPVKSYLEHQGYEVYSEVVLPGGSRADIVGLDKHRTVCIEMKKTLSMDLIDQAIERKSCFAFVYLAIPERKSPLPRFVERIFRQHGFGILYVLDDGDVYEKRKPIYRRAFNKKFDPAYYLKPEQKIGVPGGTQGGGYVTDYSLMIRDVKRYLSRQTDWVELGQVLEHCEVRYSNPRSGLSKALRSFETDWCEVKKINHRLHVRMKPK
jgi:hypothetical protein